MQSLLFLCLCVRVPMPTNDLFFRMQKYSNNVEKQAWMSTTTRFSRIHELKTQNWPSASAQTQWNIQESFLGSLEASMHCGNYNILLYRCCKLVKIKLLDNLLIEKKNGSAFAFKSIKRNVYIVFMHIELNSYCHSHIWEKGCIH